MTTDDTISAVARHLAQARRHHIAPAANHVMEEIDDGSSLRCRGQDRVRGWVGCDLRGQSAGKIMALRHACVLHG